MMACEVDTRCIKMYFTADRCYSPEK